MKSGDEKKEFCHNYNFFERVQDVFCCVVFLVPGPNGRRKFYPPGGFRTGDLPHPERTPYTLGQRELPIWPEALGVFHPPGLGRDITLHPFPNRLRPCSDRHHASTSQLGSDAGLRHRSDLHVSDMSPSASE